MKISDFDVVLLERPVLEGLSVADVEGIGALIKTDKDVDLVEVPNPESSEFSAMGAVSSPVWSLFSDKGGGDLVEFVKCILGNIIKEDPDHAYIFRSGKCAAPIKIYIGR